jgi:trans-2,3-dihydro-3-hydroxyanthranilate isomerase
MTTERRYRILNVFAIEGSRLSGNPLCVFEDGSGLTDESMQAIARQLNLSETTFLLPARASGATTGVRIFTPSFEMPFAGHPTLGTAHVTRDLFGCGDRVVLETKVGLVEVTAKGDAWTLRTAKAPETRKLDVPPAEVAKMLGLSASALAGEPRWVDTGSEQLVIPLAAPRHVREARPDTSLLARYARSEKRGESLAYVWAREGGQVTARFFFVSGGSVVEDPATGSACANLGGYLIVTGENLPFSLEVTQGDEIKRPSILRLTVDADKNVFVSGLVIELGRGTFTL